jgi:hypothetical protein
LAVLLPGKTVYIGKRTVSEIECLKEHHIFVQLNNEKPVNDMPTNIQTRQIIFFHRILRWALGTVFILVGTSYWKQDGWPVLVFGGIIFLTGFFTPRRCINNACETPSSQSGQQG